MGKIMSRRFASGRAATALLSAGLAVLLLACPVAARDLPDQSELREMLRGMSQGLDIRADELTSSRRETSELLANLREDLEKIGNRFRQIQLLRAVSGDTPWAVRTILIQVHDLQDDLRLKSRSLIRQKEQLLRAREDDGAFLDAGDAASAGESTDTAIDGLRPVLERLKAVRSGEDEVLYSIDAGLAPVDNLSGRIDALKAKDIGRFIKTLVEYSYGRRESLLSQGGRRTALSEMRVWRNDFPQFFAILVDWMRWSDAFWYTLVPFALLYWVAPAMWVRAGLRTRRAGRAPRGLGWFLFSLGLGASVSLRCGLFTFNQFTGLGASVLATLGLVMVLEGEGEEGAGKDPGEPSGLPSGTEHAYPLFTLWGLFAAGAAAQALDIPPTALGLLSAVICGLTAWRLHAMRKPDAADGRATWRALSAGLMTLLALAAPLGFGHQTLILGQAWFMLLIILRTMEAFKAGLYGKGAVAADGRGAGVSVVAYPLVASVLGVTYVLWVLMFIGGPGFLEYTLAYRWTLGAMSFDAGALGLILVLFFALRLVLAWIKLVSVHARFRGETLSPAMSHTVNATVSYVAWTAFTLLSIRLLGISLSSLTWIASGLSVGVGFGLKDIVNNFISGLIILFGGAIKKGDVIQQGKNLGEVIDLSVRNTTIRTPDNTMVIIPNSMFLRGEIINLSYQDAKTRLTIPVTVVPGTKVKKVLKILLAVANDSGAILKYPRPEASLVRFGKLGLEFELYVWIENFLKKFDIEAELVTEMDKRFSNEKVMLAFQGAKYKYKPKGSEEEQLESSREQLREKRREHYAKVRPLRHAHARGRTNPGAA
jgi:small-conductance mechanosensitive channel